MAKFAATCRLARLVIAGNQALADTARRWARRVEVVPTPVDLGRYPERPPAGRRPRTLVWIGLPENLDYLEALRPVLGRLASEVPDLVLRVVCSRFPDWPEVEIEGVPWSEEGEAQALATAGVGLMPLVDNAWGRGKCAFKLLQYMAAGLPCVASPVGANRDVVEQGVSGFLAAGDDQWEAALRRLLDDPEVALRMGRAGRDRVRRDFDRRVVIPRLADLLEEAAC
jgi:glycosyltransferase involved in cell wall biosynthesis